MDWLKTHGPLIAATALAFLMTFNWYTNQSLRNEFNATLNGRLDANRNEVIGKLEVISTQLQQLQGAFNKATNFGFQTDQRGIKNETRLDMLERRVDRLENQKTR